MLPPNTNSLRASRSNGITRTNPKPGSREASATGKFPNRRPIDVNDNRKPNSLPGVKHRLKPNRPPSGKFDPNPTGRDRARVIKAKAEDDGTRKNNRRTNKFGG